jgi:hypothetical protein
MISNHIAVKHLDPQTDGKEFSSDGPANRCLSRSTQAREPNSKPLLPIDVGSTGR